MRTRFLLFLSIALTVPVAGAMNQGVGPPTHVVELEDLSSIKRVTSSIEVKKEVKKKDPLHAALRENNIDEARRLITRGLVDVNDKCGNRNTPLHTAVCNGNKDMVVLLLSIRGIKPNEPDADGWAPIHAAVFYGRKDILVILLSDDWRSIININAAIVPTLSNQNNKIGETPLHFAAREGFSDMAELLCSKGAVVDALSLGGKTPLHIAMFYEHKKVEATLLRWGADPSIPAPGIPVLPSPLGSQYGSYGKLAISRDGSYMSNSNL